MSARTIVSKPTRALEKAAMDMDMTVEEFKVHREEKKNTEKEAKVEAAKAEKEESDKEAASKEA